MKKKLDWTKAKLANKAVEDQETKKRVTKYTIKRYFAHTRKDETAEQAEARLRDQRTKAGNHELKPLYNHVVARWDKKRGLLWRIAPTYEFDTQDNLSCYYKLTDASTGAVLLAQKSVSEWLGSGIMDPDQGAELLKMIDPIVLARLAE